jgi:hypothetical protein
MYNDAACLVNEVETPFAEAGIRYPTGKTISGEEHARFQARADV